VNQQGYYQISRKSERTLDLICKCKGMNRFSLIIKMDLSRHLLCRKKKKEAKVEQKQHVCDIFR
jgi:type II secretory pathway component PulJ